MQNQFSRTEMLLGGEAMKTLASSRVAVFGIGGVGGYTVEALARSGIGALDIIDSDKICLTNINRQIFATLETVGRYKVDVAARRIAEINPDCRVTAYKTFYSPQTRDEIDFAQYDYVVDAIDTVTGKLTIIENAEKCLTPVISAMGAGNKLDPTAFKVADIYGTSGCPLAKVMRRELKKRGIKKLKVVYSAEEPIKPINGAEADRSPESEESNSTGRNIPASIAFVPSVAGLIIAGEVIKDLIARNKIQRSRL